MILEITGSVNRPGRYEVDAGMSFVEFLNSKAEGVSGGKALKALIPWGAASPALDASEALAVNMDEESFARAGARLGGEKLVVLSEEDSVPQALLKGLQEYEDGCCRKTASCREGARLMTLIAQRIASRGGTASYANSMLDAAFALMCFASCDKAKELGRFVASTVTKFWSEFSGSGVYAGEVQGETR